MGQVLAKVIEERAQGTYHRPLNAIVALVERVGENAVLVLESTVVPNGRGFGYGCEVSFREGSWRMGDRSEEDGWTTDCARIARTSCQSPE